MSVCDVCSTFIVHGCCRVFVNAIRDEVHGPHDEEVTQQDFYAGIHGWDSLPDVWSVLDAKEWHVRFPVQSEHHTEKLSMWSNR